MTESIMQAIDLSGWIALSALVGILLVQSRAIRLFQRPRHVSLSTWPSLSVMLSAKEPDATIRGSIADVSALDYAGDLEIVVVADAGPESESMKQLAIASSRLRVVKAPHFTAAVPETRGEWILFLPHGIRVEKDAIQRLVSTAIEDELDAAVLSPRIELQWGRSMLVEPLLGWLRMTISPLLARGVPLIGSALLVKREHCLAMTDDEVITRARILDGYDSASRTELDPARYRASLRSSGGGTTGRLFILALTLPLLFTLPIIMAVLTTSFPWIVSAIVSYWVRFRVAARTGEPIPAAFLHPLAVLVMTVDMIEEVVLGQSARNNHAQRP